MDHIARSSSSGASPSHHQDRASERYWKSNLRIMAVLLLVWAAVGLGAGVLFADTLNAYQIGGYPLGFWFAQQGSIIVFVVLILVYAVMMNRLDKRHHEEWVLAQHEDALAAQEASSDPSGGPSGAGPGGSA